MQAVVKTFRQHLLIVRCYPAAMTLVGAAFLLVLYTGYVEHRMPQAIAYLAAVWLGAFVVDLTVNIHPRRAIGYPVKRPVWKELSAILGCTLLGFVFLVVRFGALWQDLHAYRVILIPLMLFVFPIALALIYLFHFRYRPNELGINLHYWYLPLPIHFILGTLAFTVAHNLSHWHTALKIMGGVSGLFFTGIINAALAEEFTRMLVQTRLARALNNRGLGFVLASFIWATMHLPITAEGSETAWPRVLLAVWTLVPIGLLWGYITHRTKSLLPAVLLHGLNLWGLQSL